MILTKWPRRDWTRFAAPIVFVAIAYLVRQIFLSSVGRSLPYVTFYPAVLLSALYGGFYAGVTAAICSVLVNIIAIIGISQLKNLSLLEILAQIAFPLISLLTAYLIESAYKIHTKAQQKNQQLLELNNELLQQKQNFQALVENLPFMITRFDREHNVIYAHPALHTTGKAAQAESQKPALPFSSLFTEHSYFETAFATKTIVEFDMECNTPQGINYYHNIIIPEPEKDGAVHNVLVVTRDLTLEKQMQKELFRLDRLNIIGEMAASIGHELRNPLTTVRGYLQFFECKSELAVYKNQIDTMIEELDRANFIITEFLSLAKNKAVNTEICDLNDNIRSILPLLQADALHSGHHLTSHLGDIPALTLDKKEIRQVLLNLVRNAVEATPSAGKIIVKTEYINKQVVLSVQDNGEGISQEIIDKLGTPFVTTKDSGIGLGLSVCYRIAERHKATLTFETSPAGTTFFLKFNV